MGDRRFQLKQKKSRQLRHALTSREQTRPSISLHFDSATQRHPHRRISVMQQPGPLPAHADSPGAPPVPLLHKGSTPPAGPRDRSLQCLRQTECAEATEQPGLAPGRNHRDETQSSANNDSGSGHARRRGRARPMTAGVGMEQHRGRRRGTRVAGHMGDGAAHAVLQEGTSRLGDSILGAGTFGEALHKWCCMHLCCPPDSKNSNQCARPEVPTGAYPALITTPPPPPSSTAASGIACPVPLLSFLLAVLRVQCGHLSNTWNTIFSANPINLDVEAERVCRRVLPGVCKCPPFEEGILHTRMWGGGGGGDEEGGFSKTARGGQPVGRPNSLGGGGGGSIVPAQEWHSQVLFLPLSVPWGVPCDTPKWCQNGTWLAKWPELIFSIRAHGATHKTVSIFAGSEFGWTRLLLEMEDTNDI